ncbi:MAG: FAD-dependent oxidoreductase [Oscillatoria sp. SIO1A7]|nr:FAD-dependent oxidoreductase [Oscillatoria sp. SIO1A7]
MARSPLIRLLRRAYKVAQVSRKRQIPRAEVLGMLQEKASRRRLLQASLGFAGAVAANRLTQGPRAAVAQSGIEPVLIVGAGISGLTAAYRLATAGVPVNIIEARNQVGGRMRSLPKAAGTAITAELGGEFINTDHTCLRNLAEELGFNVLDVEAAQQGLNRESYFFEGRLISEEELIRDFAPVAQQINADLEILENFEDYTTADQPTIDLDRLSITEYLDRIPTTPVVRQIVRIAYNVEYGRDPEEQSSLNLIFLIGAEPGEFELLGISDERFYIDGGNQQVPRQLAELLASSVEVGTVLESISSTANGRYRVSMRAGQSTFDRIYERVLLALPFTVLRTIPLNVDLPPVKRLAIDTLGYGTNAKLITAYREPIWRSRYNSNGRVLSDLGFQNIWESTQGVFTASGGSRLITNFTGGRHGVLLGSATPQAHAQTLLPQLEQVFPGISSLAIPGKEIRAYWPGELYNQGSYSCYLPGQWTQMYGSEGERVGNLFFAGEHTSVECQGFMEGGCETGEATALEILQDLGLQAPAAQQRERLQNSRSQRINPRSPRPFQRFRR